MPTPIRHHYIPCFYLSHFADSDGLVYVYEKGHPGLRSATPKNVGVEKHFYTASTVEKERDTELVERFMAHVEGLAAPALRKLLEREPLSPQERADFAYFVAMMYLRVPAFRAFNQQMREGMYKEQFKWMASRADIFDTYTDLLTAETGVDYPPEAREDIRDMLLQEDYSITFHPEDAMRMIPLAKDWCLTMQRMHWTLYEAPKGRQFVTSDNPLVLVDASDPQRVGD